MRNKRLKQNPTAKGFTLAEVLITLVIIGVIAALTVPTLLQNKEKQETITGLKEANAILANAISMAKSEYGDPSTWDYSLYGDAFATTYITPYLKVAKICGTGGDPGCFNAPNSGWYDISGNFLYGGGGYDAYNHYKFTLDNGMDVGVWRNVPGNNYSVIVVDVNGDKGPTKYGRDVFVFSVSKVDGFNMGLQKYTNTREELLGTNVYGGCNKTAPYTGINSAGVSCGVVILKDGWQIKDDYPW